MALLNRARYTIARATTASKMPATTSSQKWLPVAMTANHTHAGQSSQTTFQIGRLTTDARMTPAMRASAACRLGMAAYGFDASSMRPLPWFSPPNWVSVSVKPIEVNSRGGGGGRETQTNRTSTCAGRNVFPESVNGAVWGEKNP